MVLNIVTDLAKLVPTLFSLKIMGGFTGIVKESEDECMSLSQGMETWAGNNWGDRRQWHSSSFVWRVDVWHDEGLMLWLFAETLCLVWLNDLTLRPLAMDMINWVRHLHKRHKMSQWLTDWPPYYEEAIKKIIKHRRILLQYCQYAGSFYTCFTVTRA